MEVLRSKIAERERPERDATIEGIYGSKGFFFQQRRGHLDLRGITNIDLEKVVREVDVDSLQLYIENITFCNLREEDLRYLTDPQVIKLFKMSQLIIEYLLYSQDLFVANLGDLSKKYVAKKKSLSKKRRELAELEEATKHLRNQVKAKKQNISTLEDLLRENARREPKVQRVKEVEHEPKPMKLDKITFFVAGPDGLCVEFTERQESSIYTLRKAVTQAFITKKDVENENYNKVIRLVHKGIMLVDDRTIEYYSIKPGDTVVAVIEKGEAIAPAPQATAAPKSDNNLSEMIEFLSKQQDAMRQFAQDIKYGWENALQTMKGNRNDDLNFAESEKRLLTKIDDKWNIFESGMRLQLEAKLNDYQALLLSRQQAEEKFPNIQVIRRRPILGELEDDDDNAALNDINNKLNRFGNQLNNLEDKSVRTDESIDDIRNALKNRPATVTVAAAPRPVTPLVSQPVAKVEIAPPVVVSPKKVSEVKTFKSDGNAIDPRRNKWNDLDAPIQVAAASEVKTADHATVNMGSFEVPAEKKTLPPKLKIPEPEPVKVIQKPAEKVKAVRKVDPPKVVEKKPVVKAIPMVDIVFPSVYHTDDLSVFHGAKVLLVQLPENLPSEDVVFILRKEIANKVQVPLTRVTLVLRGKSITLDMDADEEVLTVESIKSYASNGTLIFKVNKGKPLTNAQLDLLVPSWQRASKDEVKTEPSANASEKSKPKFKKRRDWNDDIPDDDPNLLSKNMYNVVRSSLDEALSGVSDREGLTDDELHQKMESLKLFTETLPSTVSDHLKNYRGKVTNSITQATIDSGSEDFLPRVSPLVTAGGNVNDSLSVKKSKLLTVSRVGRVPDSPLPMSPGSATRRSVEDYNSEEDFVAKFSTLKDDSPVMASLTASTDLKAQFRAAAAKSYNNAMRSSGASGASRNNNLKRDAKGVEETKLVNTTSTTDSLLYSPSQSVNSSRAHRYSGNPAATAELHSDLDDDEDHSDEDQREYATVSRVQNRKGASSGRNSARNSADFGEGKVNHIDKTMLSSINTLPSVGEGHSDDEHYDVMDDVDSEVGDFVDLSQTVDSEGDMLVKNHAVRSSAVRRKADDYEREAAAAINNVRTPPHRRNYDRDSPDGKSNDNRTFSNASKASNVSLFNNLQSSDMVDDFEESVHSLAFSANDDD